MSDESSWEECITETAAINAAMSAGANPWKQELTFTHPMSCNAAMTPGVDQDVPQLLPSETYCIPAEGHEKGNYKNCGRRRAANRWGGGVYVPACENGDDVCVLMGKHAVANPDANAAIACLVDTTGGGVEQPTPIIDDRSPACTCEAALEKACTACGVRGLSCSHSSADCITCSVDESEELRSAGCTEDNIKTWCAAKAPTPPAGGSVLNCEMVLFDEPGQLRSFDLVHDAETNQYVSQPQQWDRYWLEQQAKDLTGETFPEWAACTSRLVSVASALDVDKDELQCVADPVGRCTGEPVGALGCPLSRTPDTPAECIRHGGAWRNTPPRITGLDGGKCVPSKSRYKGVSQGPLCSGLVNDDVGKYRPAEGGQAPGCDDDFWCSWVETDSEGSVVHCTAEDAAYGRVQCRIHQTNVILTWDATQQKYVKHTSH